MRQWSTQRPVPLSHQCSRNSYQWSRRNVRKYRVNRVRVTQLGIVSESLNWESCQSHSTGNRVRVTQLGIVSESLNWESCHFKIIIYYCILFTSVHNVISCSCFSFTVIKNILCNQNSLLAFACYHLLLWHLCYSVACGTYVVLGFVTQHRLLWHLKSCIQVLTFWSVEWRVVTIWPCFVA